MRDELQFAEIHSGVRSLVSSLERAAAAEGLAAT